MQATSFEVLFARNKGVDFNTLDGDCLLVLLKGLTKSKSSNMIALLILPMGVAKTRTNHPYDARHSFLQSWIAAGLSIII